MKVVGAGRAVAKVARVVRMIESIFVVSSEIKFPLSCLIKVFKSNSVVALGEVKSKEGKKVTVEANERKSRLW